MRKARILDAAHIISTTSKGQSSQALVLQGYANSVLEQPTVDFSQFETLLKYQTDINTGLGKAKDHAHTYLNNIQPATIRNITDIYNYYSLHNAIASTAGPNTTQQQWLKHLGMMQEQAQQYVGNATQIVSDLRTFHDEVATDASAFNLFVVDLNTAVKGDRGVLSSIDGELSSLQSQIDGAIAGMAVSGLAILGGVFMIVVGAIADFVTAGTTTPLIIAGVAVVAVGVGGEVASALTFKALNDEKANLLKKKAHLNEEVKLAQGLSTGYSALANGAKAALNAATQMQNAWNFLHDDLNNLASDLQNGITSTGDLRQIWLNAANSVVRQVEIDTNIIKKQMAGVESVTAPSGTSIGDFAVAEAKKRAA